MANGGIDCLVLTAVNAVGLMSWSVSNCKIVILVGLNRYVAVQNLNIFFHATLRN